MAKVFRRISSPRFEAQKLERERQPYLIKECKHGTYTKI